MSAAYSVLHPGAAVASGVAVRDGDFVELDQAYGSAGAQRGDGGYEGVDVWQLCVTRVTAVLDMVVIPVLSVRRLVAGGSVREGEVGVRAVPDRMDDLVGSLQLWGVAGVG